MLCNVAVHIGNEVLNRHFTRFNESLFLCLDRRYIWFDDFVRKRGTKLLSLLGGSPNLLLVTFFFANRDEFGVCSKLAQDAGAGCLCSDTASVIAVFSFQLGAKVWIGFVA